MFQAEIYEESGQVFFFIYFLFFILCIKSGRENNDQELIRDQMKSVFYILGSGLYNKYWISDT